MSNIITRKLFLALVLSTFCNISYSQEARKVAESHFPVSVQLSPVPSGPGWRDKSITPGDSVLRETVDNFIGHGVTHICTGNPEKMKDALEYAQSLGMQIDFLSGGAELFHRETPPAHSVFTEEYFKEMSANIPGRFGAVKGIGNPYCIFPFMDEPFHADTMSFDLREPARKAFEESYGYPMPESFTEARKDPRKYLDFINFQSSTFAVAWKSIYEEIKKLDPRPLVTMTHDSHNSLGGGAGSNAVWAVDDVFHWGADFADLFVYDIYPYTAEDYRVGESGLVYRPRMSQFHWTIAQMRNLTATYGKKLGFWVGTFNPTWFSRFQDDTRRNQYWMEREMAYSAIAGGADYLITGFNVPVDARHWEDFGEGMNVIQKRGGEITRTEVPKAKACFLFPRTQHILTSREYMNVALTFELCMRAFGEIDVIHEEQVTDSDLLGYEIIILADVEILDKAAAGAIREFVRKGGTVIADCVPGQDECLEPMGIMNEVFGVSYAETGRVRQVGQWIPATTAEPFWLFVDDWKAPEKTFDSAGDFKVVSPRNCVPQKAAVDRSMASGKPLLMKNKLGKGRAYLFGFCLQDTYLQTFIEEDSEGRAALQKLVADVFGQTGVKPSAYSSNPDVEVALRKGKSKAFALVINHEAENPAAQLTLSDLGFRVGQVIDVQTGEQIPFKRSGKSVSIEVCPSLESEGGITRLLEILP